MNMDKVGVWSFYAGLVIAIIAAVVSPSGINGMVVLALGALGIIVGLLNVTDHEVKLFLIATIALVVSASSLGGILSTIPAVGKFIPALMDGIVIFVAPAAAIVALKAIWDITKSK